MENIIMIMKAVLVLGAFIAGIVLLFYPVIADLQYYGETGQHLLNYWMTGIELICIFAVYTYIPEWGSDASMEALGALTISVIVSWVVAVKRAKKLGFVGWRVAALVVTQLLSPISVIGILLLLESALNKENKDPDHKGQ